ncbi:hypothetical protein SprV_1002818400 [Sparganum proliferum]
MVSGKIDAEIKMRRKEDTDPQQSYWTEDRYRNTVDAWKSLHIFGRPTTAFEEVARTPVGHEDALEAEASNRSMIYPQ